MLTVTSCRWECCVPSGLDFEAAGDSVVCYFVSSRASSCCKHDMGMVKSRNSRKSTHPPLWQTWKVLRPWALFRETMVSHLPTNSQIKPGYEWTATMLCNVSLSPLPIQCYDHWFAHFYENFIKQKFILRNVLTWVFSDLVNVVISSYEAKQ